MFWGSASLPGTGQCYSTATGTDPLKHPPTGIHCLARSYTQLVFLIQAGCFFTFNHSQQGGSKWSLQHLRLFFFLSSLTHIWDSWGFVGPQRCGVYGSTKPQGSAQGPGPAPAGWTLPLLMTDHKSLIIPVIIPDCTTASKRDPGKRFPVSKLLWEAGCKHSVWSPNSTKPNVTCHNKLQASARMFCAELAGGADTWSTVVWAT